MTLLTITSEQLIASINSDNQQLVSLTYNGKELLHGGGRPGSEQQPEDRKGWAQTELVMFPIVGPARDNKLFVNGTTYPMGQHGISRHLPWNQVEKTRSSILYVQEYLANTPVPNSKLPTPMSWPSSFRITKKYSLEYNTLTASFTITNIGEAPMQFMFGWHPAFKLPADLESITMTSPKITVDDIRVASLSSAYFTKNNPIQCSDGETTIKVSSDMGNFMLWIPADPVLLCIEPVTDILDKKGYETLPKTSPTLESGKSLDYTVRISVQ